MISPQWLHFIAFLFIFHIRMIDRIASDLGACRYAEEPLSQYQCRVIYSAMACWMKAIALDRPIGYHEDVPLGISRRHINERSHTIVLAMNLVGSLLISALVIFPALSAMRMFKSFRSVTACAAALSVFCALIGILVSILAGTPVGSTIVAVQIIVFGLSWLAGTVIGGVRK